MQATLTIPEHIPDSLVFDVDRLQVRRSPHRSLIALYKDAPRIFFTPRNGGHWIVTRSDDALDMLRQPDNFSSDPKYSQALAREPRTNPNRYDPPEHTEFRKIVNPVFAPRAVQEKAGEIRELAHSLIEAVRANGGCEFVTSIARHFSVDIFLNLADGKTSDKEVLLDMVQGYTQAHDVAAQHKALRALGEYLSNFVAEREKNPGTDLTSLIVKGQVNGRPLTADEKVGMATLMFLGGLDTVVAMLSFIMDYLGRNPQQYRRIVDDPSLIPNAVEELMRVHGVAGMERAVTHDLEYRGIRFRAGDHIVFQPQIYGLDDEKIEDPFRVDFDRATCPHLVFGAGPHRCIGSHLARLEIRIFLEEWVKAIPRFAVTDQQELETAGGGVWAPAAVNLAWPIG